ncbi:MAG: hypothetical protein EKK64_09800 [Neisseriaceae bacterium]|nr:MAG: hypothetical protein EKK64_09800 [Neisseriaceae bacterium]
MSKTIQHFLFGFGSILDIFAPVEQLKLSKGGFAGDNDRLRGDAQKVAKTFSEVVNGYQKHKTERQR